MRMLRNVLSIMSARRAGSLASAMFLATMLKSDATAQTAIKFSLDFSFEGPSAPFLLPLDKGYYKAEGLDVSIDTAANSLEPISRVASGAYDMGFGDINSLIKFRDANPGMPIKAVFVLYNRPPFAIVGQANGIDAAKVTIENIGFPVRNPMLAAGQLDAITGFAFSSFVNLKDRGVPVNDITVLLMADYGVHLYGNAIMVNPKFAAEHPDAVKGFLRAFVKGLKETVKLPSTAVNSVLRRNDLVARVIAFDGVF